MPVCACRFHDSPHCCRLIMAKRSRWVKGLTGGFLGRATKEMHRERAGRGRETEGKGRDSKREQDLALLQNFLLTSFDEDARLEACDFGLSAYFKPGQRFTELIGSPYYVVSEAELLPMCRLGLGCVSMHGWQVVSRTS